MYEDKSLSADNTGITIHRYGLFPTTKRIPFTSIRSATPIDMGIAGRWRVVGTGFNRNWYNWDVSRHTKTRAIVIDTGAFIRPTVTPEDPEAFTTAISGQVSMT